MTMKQIVATILAAASLLVAGGLICAAGEYGPGVSDAEIKIGNAMPYSGPASALGATGKAEAAYFNMINAQGGISGRKIKFISRDDSYSPPKTVEVVRKLVEQDEVLLMFSVLGTPPNTAIQGYLNDNKVPQLFAVSGADKWNNPRKYPWTMGWRPSYRVEARIYGRYILNNLPNAKIGVLYQNDDFGEDYLVGLREALGDRADKMIVATQSYETTDPTIDSQIVALQASGANVLVTAAIPKSAAQAIRKVYDIGWKPTHFLTSVSISVGAVMQPAGTREKRRHHHGGLSERPDRPAVAGYARLQGMAGLDEEIQHRGQYRRQLQRLRLRVGADHGRRAQGERQHSHPRKRDEAGSQHPQSCGADAAAGHHALHQRGRFRPNQTDAIGEVRRRDLAGVWRSALGDRPLISTCSKNVAANQDGGTLLSWVSDTSQVRHSKVYNSGRPWKRSVLRTSRIGCAQIGQRGGVCADLLALSSDMKVTGSRRHRRPLACQHRARRTKMGTEHCCGVAVGLMFGNRSERPVAARAYP